MNSEVVKLYPESQVREIQLSYPEGHVVFLKPVSFKGMLQIGEVLKDSALSFSDKANEEKVFLSFLLEQTPEVIQKVLRLAYGDEEIEVDKLYAEEVLGLLKGIIDVNEGLKKGVESFFAPFGGAEKVLRLLLPKSSPVLSPTDTAKDTSSTPTPSTR
jgi:hypothetical protein